jgi:predicted nucleic acid-binding protein
MIVYVESNFCLELVFQQEEEAQAEEILQLAEAGRLELVLPQFAVCEPFSTLNRYENERRRFLNELNKQLSELDRSIHQQQIVAGTQPLVAMLTRIGQDQTNRLKTVVERMLGCGRTVPLTAPLFASARQVEGQFDLSPQDAIVAASVLGDLQPQNAPQNSHAFLSRNSKDFNPMRAEFTALGCRYLAKFDAGLQFIHSKI